MDEKDNQETFPSLPTNYITIVDLQKRWLEQQQQKNKQLKHESKSDKPEELNKTTHFSNPNSHFQKKGFQLNPNSKPRKPFRYNFYDKKPSQSNVKEVEDEAKINKNTHVSNPNSQFQKSTQFNPNFKTRKPFHYDFNDKKPSQSNAADAVVVDSVKEVEEPKIEGENKRKKKNKKYNKMKKGNDDQEKGEVNDDDDQTVEIKPNFKKGLPTATIEAPKRVYGGNRWFNRRELHVKDTHKVCVEERDNVGEEKGERRGAVREETQLHGRESKLENKVSAERVNVGEVKGKTRGVVREEIQLHGREFKVESISAEETDNQGDVHVDDQTAEIVSKFTRVSVSGKYWRPRATIEGSEVGYSDYRRVPHKGREFHLKNRQFVQKSFRPVRDGTKLHRGIGRAVNKGFDRKDQKGEQNSELGARDLHGEVGGLENVVCDEKASNQGHLNARNDDPNGGNGSAKIEQKSGREAREVHWELGGLENVVCALKPDNSGEVKGGIDDQNGKSMAVRNEWGARGEPWKRFGYGRSNTAVPVGHRSWNRGYRKRDLLWVKRVDLNDKS